MVHKNHHKDSGAGSGSCPVVKKSHIFTLDCGLAAGNGAAHEPELYIDLFAFPGKASALHDPDQPAAGDGRPEGSVC